MDALEQLVRDQLGQLLLSNLMLRAELEAIKQAYAKLSARQPNGADVPVGNS